jgi:hypothetical protein
MGRAYFAYERYSLGVNSMGQKGDWAHWLNVLTCAISIAILGLWFLYQIIALMLSRRCSKIKDSEVVAVGDRSAPVWLIFP